MASNKRYNKKNPMKLYLCYTAFIIGAAIVCSSVGLFNVVSEKIKGSKNNKVRKRKIALN